ncbi:MAG: ABC transporter permease [Myxococcota bacterium]|jgi:ABC-2 type transport system permease protein|nr:ABC transporter permease [Myxococcota bacterium]
MGAIRAIVRKELRQTFRDKRMVVILFVAPLVQTLIFGFAVNLDLVEQPLVLVDEDGTAASRAVVEALSHDEALEVVAVVKDHGQAAAMLQDNRAAISIEIPRGYEDKAEKGEAQVLIAVDGADSNTALRTTQVAGQILAARASSAQRDKLSKVLTSRGLSADNAVAQLDLSIRAMFNPQLRTAIFLVPGVLGMVLTVITMILTAMGLSRERELGTLEQLMVTPLRPSDLVLGKTLPFSILGLAEVGLVVCLAVLVFDVPVRGSLWLLFAVSAAFLLTTLGMGLLVATFSETQQQAMLSAFFVILPAIMLSGFVFPVEHMPLFAKWIASINPLTYYIALVRGILVRGADIEHMWQDAAMLVGIGLVVFSTASLKFRKRLA